MTSFLSDSQFENVIYGTDQMSLSALWNATNNDGLDASYIPLVFQPFTARKSLFIWILERLLREGRIKLHKNGVFLQGSIEMQVQRFQEAWPETDKPYPDHPDAGFDLWFFDPVCPAGVAWRRADGSYLIDG